jgi:MtN3 and saliva related transmembrane protein
MLKDVFGYSAGFIAAIMYFPQIKKMYITKSTDDISMNTIFLLIICSILWIIYGIYLMEWPVIITDVIILLQVLTMLSLKIYHEKLYCCRNRANSIDQVITASTQ